MYILCFFNTDFFSYHQHNNTQEAIVYKEYLKKLEKQNKEMVEKVTNVDQKLALHFHSSNTSLLFQKEQLHLEQQQLYQLINIFEVNNIK